MSVFWKGLVVVLLALPVGAYVTSSLVESRAELPDRLDPVLVSDPDRPVNGDRARDRDDEVEVIRPEPRDVRDDEADDDDGDGDDDGTDHD